MEDLLTVSEAAEAYRMPEHTIRHLFHRGLLQGCKVGKQIRIKEEGVRVIEKWEEKELKAVHKEEKTAKKELRKGLVSDLGGINDSDYESLPHWCKRKEGTTLDDITEYLSREGYYCESADEAYEVLREELKA